MKIIPMSVILFLFCVQTGYAAFETLKDPVPASSGMGNANISLIRDSAALLINPAGLGEMEKTSILVSGSLLYPGISETGNYKALALAGIPLLKGMTAGTGFIYFSSYHYSELSALLGAGFQPVKNVNLGMTLKLMKWSGDVVSINDVVVMSLGSTVFSLDAGAKISILPEFVLGMRAKNINSPVVSSKSSAVKENLPREYAFGLGLLKDLWTADLDIDYSLGFFEYRLGGEIYLLNKILVLRAGTVLYEMGSQGFQANAGFSLNLPVLKKKIRIDYATGLNQASPSLSSHNIAFTFTL